MARKFPVVTVTGPRQSGKTTLCRNTFSEKAYVSLEAPDVRDFARRDPRGFLAGYREGGMLDKIQRVPELLSHIQTMVDERPARARFILTGSANYSLLHSIGQSLAGRTAVLELLPVSLAEVRRFSNCLADLFAPIRRGRCPAMYNRILGPSTLYFSCVSTCHYRE